MSDLEIREASNADEWILEGYASKFGVPYTVNDRQGKYTETVHRGAFTGTLAKDPDTLLLMSHAGSPLARTKPSRTLQLTQDSTGLFVHARLGKDDPEAQAAVSKVRRGLIEQMSFSFRIDGKDGQRWSDDWARRELIAVDVDHGDVSLTPFGASPSTSVAMRGGATTTQERRAMAEAIGYSARGYAPTGSEAIEARAGYPAHELALLGKQGKALAGPDGGWRFPTLTRQDLEDAVKDVPQAKGDPAVVRRYLYARAKAMGLLHLVPPTWRSDGSIRVFGSRSDSTLEAELRRRVAAYQSGTRVSPAELELRTRVTVARAKSHLLERQLRARAKGR